VVGTTVPVVYPHLLGGEAVLNFFAKINKVKVINRFFKKIGLDRMVRMLGCLGLVGCAGGWV